MSNATSASALALFLRDLRAAYIHRLEQPLGDVERAAVLSWLDDLDNAAASLHAALARSPKPMPLSLLERVTARRAALSIPCAKPAQARKRRAP